MNYEPITWGHLIAYTASRTKHGSQVLYRDQNFINFVERSADSGIGGQKLLDLAVAYVKENR